MTALRDSPRISSPAESTTMARSTLRTGSGCPRQTREVRIASTYTDNYPIHLEKLTNSANLDNNQSSYFRGHKLRGRRVAIPEGYTGIVATTTDRVSQQPVKNASAENEVTELEEPVKILETQGTFDDMIVWGHEILPAADDPYVKGVEEWVRFAETVRTSMCPHI